MFCFIDAAMFGGFPWTSAQQSKVDWHTDMRWLLHPEHYEKAQSCWAGLVSVGGTPQGLHTAFPSFHGGHDLHLALWYPPNLWANCLGDEKHALQSRWTSASERHNIRTECQCLSSLRRSLRRGMKAACRCFCKCLWKSLLLWPKSPKTPSEFSQMSVKILSKENLLHVRLGCSFSLTLPRSWEKTEVTTAPPNSRKPIRQLYISPYLFLWSIPWCSLYSLCLNMRTI